MKLILTYTNNTGTVYLCGTADSAFAVTDIRGLSLPEREYITASYSGYDGQETISATYLPRVITIAGDILSPNATRELARAIDIMSEEGYLYIQTDRISRRICCNRVTIPDAERILRSKVCSFTVQFVCDSPFFEDTTPISVPLYNRTAELSAPFSLPCMFGKTVSEAEISLNSRNTVEPIIHIIFPVAISESSTVSIVNCTNGAKIELPYSPQAGEEIVIDIRNRTATSTVQGNILHLLSDDTFLSDFLLYPSTNRLTATVGNINAGIFVECTYSNRYNEAIFV